MAILWVSNGAANSGGTNTVTPSYPSPVAAGDLLIEACVTKYSNRTINTPSLWTARGNQTGGAGTDGTSDEGNLRLGVFTTEALGTESGTLSRTLTGGTANMTASRISRFTRGGSAWDIGTAAVAALNAGGTTAVSFAFGTDPGFQAGDVAVVIAAYNSDTYSYGSHALSAAGCTFVAHSASAEPYDSGFTDGSDARFVMACFDVSAGTSSGNATYTCTATGSATNSPAGAAVLLRLRETGGGSVDARAVQARLRQQATRRMSAALWLANMLMTRSPLPTAQTNQAFALVPPTGGLSGVASHHRQVASLLRRMRRRR